MAKKSAETTLPYTMTTIFVAAFVLVVIGGFMGYITARSKYNGQVVTLTDMVMQKGEDINSLQSRMKDQIIMLNGKMMIKKQETIPMEQDMTMTDGTKVMTDGTVILNGGKTIMMQDGDRMMMDGKILRK